MPPPKAGKVNQDANEKIKQHKLTEYGLRSEAQKANTSSSNSPPGIVTMEADEDRTQSSKVDEILSIVTAIKSDMDHLRQDVRDCAERVTQAETRISNNEDEVVILRAKASALESKQKTLEDKVMDLESRSRRNNVRLVNLAEGSEGRDPCKFLERWLPEALGITLQTPMFIERAHRIGPRKEDGSNRPRTLIMRFLNYRDKEAVLNAAKAKGDIRYEGEWIRFYPDLAAGVQQLRKRYDSVREDLRKLGLRHGVTHQGKLLVTYEEKTLVFTSPAEAHVFVNKIQTEGGDK